jgi:hypothetical protein
VETGEGTAKEGPQPPRPYKTLKSRCQGKCKLCGARIVNLPLPNLGKTIPVDWGSMDHRDFEYSHARHISHYLTCPFADDHRRRRLMEQTFGKEC